MFDVMKSKARIDGRPMQYSDGFPHVKGQLAPIPSSFCNWKIRPSQILGRSLYVSGRMDQLHQILIKRRVRSPKHTAKSVELGSEVIWVGEAWQ